MLRLVKKILNKRYIRFDFIGDSEFDIKSNLNDQEIEEFLYMIYSQSLTMDIIDYLKNKKQAQYIRVSETINKKAEDLINQASIVTNEDYENKPIIGVLSENNNMGRS